MFFNRWDSVCRQHFVEAYHFGKSSATSFCEGDIQLLELYPYPPCHSENKPFLVVDEKPSWWIYWQHTDSQIGRVLPKSQGEQQIEQTNKTENRNIKWSRCVKHASKTWRSLLFRCNRLFLTWGGSHMLSGLIGLQDTWMSQKFP